MRSDPLPQVAGASAAEAPGRVHQLLRLDILAGRKPLYIYGAGGSGRYMLSRLRRRPDIAVTAFVDAGKQGEIDGLPILSPETFLRDADPRATVLVASVHWQEIVDRLTTAGLSEIHNAAPYIERYFFCPALRLTDRDDPSSLEPLNETDGSDIADQDAYRDGWQTLESGIDRVSKGDLDGFADIRRAYRDSGQLLLGNDVFDAAFQTEAEDVETLVQLYNQAIARGLFPHQRLLEERQRGLDAGLPSVFISTLPKSGSVWLTSHFLRKYRLPLLPRLELLTKRLVPGMVKLGASGGFLCHGHIEATAGNLDLLAEAGFEKLLINVRDPRQATISWLHYTAKVAAQPDGFINAFSLPRLPVNFHRMSWDDKLEWGMTEVFPRFVMWVMQWCDAAERDSRFDILLNDYASLVQDEIGCLNRMARFLGLPEAFVEDDIIQKDTGMNYRRGEAEEWRGVFTPRQQDLMAAMIPAELTERFAWAT